MNRAICLLLMLLKVQASSLRESKKRIPYSPKDISEATAILSATREAEQREAEVSALAAAVASVSDAFERSATVDEYPVPVLEQETSLSLETTVDATATASEEEEDEYERGFIQLLEALRLGHVAPHTQPLAGEELVTVSTVNSVEELSLREQLRRESRLLDESHDKPFEEIDGVDTEESKVITPSTDTAINADTPPSSIDTPSTPPSTPSSTTSFRIALALYNQFLNAPNRLHLSFLHATHLHSQPLAKLSPFHLLLSLARIIRTLQGSYPRAQVFLEPWRLERALSSGGLSEKMRGAELCLWLGMEGVARDLLASHVPQKIGPGSIQLAGVEYVFPACEADGVTQLAWMSAAMGLEKVYALVTEEAEIEENDKEFFALLLK